MELYFRNTLRKNLNKYKKIYNGIFEYTINKMKIKNNCICSITFVSKNKIHLINKEYRKIDRPTDVISFAYLDSKELLIEDKNVPLDLGEIYICYDVAIMNAKKYGNSIDRELSFLFVHGLLHLLGYDHMKKEDEEIMFPLQEKILKGYKK